MQSCSTFICVFSYFSGCSGVTFQSCSFRVTGHFDRRGTEHVLCGLHEGIMLKWVCFAALHFCCAGLFMRNIHLVLQTGFIETKVVLTGTHTAFTGTSPSQTLVHWNMHVHENKPLAGSRSRQQAHAHKNYSVLTRTIGPFMRTNASDPGHGGCKSSPRKNN